MAKKFLDEDYDNHARDNDNSSGGCGAVDDTTNDAGVWGEIF